MTDEQINKIYDNCGIDRLHECFDPFGRDLDFVESIVWNKERIELFEMDKLKDEKFRAVYIRTIGEGEECFTIHGTGLTPHYARMNALINFFEE